MGLSDNYDQNIWDLAKHLSNLKYKNKLMQSRFDLIIDITALLAGASEFSGNYQQVNVG